jgi:hypothetical protein
VVSTEDNEEQVMLVLIVMSAQFLYLLIVRLLSSPLKMAVELFSAGCECITTLLVYWLIGDPSASEEYGVIMQMLMMANLAGQVLAQFGAVFDDAMAYLEMALSCCFVCSSMDGEGAELKAGAAVKVDVEAEGEDAAPETDNETTAPAVVLPQEETTR